MDSDRSAEVQAMMIVLERSVGFLTEVIAVVIAACAERNSLDEAKLRSMLDEIASRPDVNRVERALTERLLRTLP